MTFLKKHENILKYVCNVLENKEGLKEPSEPTFVS